jgi:hypothetical protein
MNDSEILIFDISDDNLNIFGNCVIEFTPYPLEWSLKEHCNEALLSNWSTKLNEGFA